MLAHSVQTLLARWWHATKHLELIPEHLLPLLLLLHILWLVGGGEDLLLLLLLVLLLCLWQCLCAPLPLPIQVALPLRLHTRLCCLHLVAQTVGNTLH